MDAASIHSLVEERRRTWSGVAAGMAKVRDTYYGEIAVNLPDLDSSGPPPVPNLLAQGVDQMSGRIASVQPTVQVTATGAGRRNERKAATAQRVLAAWWASDKMPLKMNARARHLTAYGMTATSLKWNHDTHRPQMIVRNPIGVLPDPDLKVDDPIPRDVVFVYARSGKWLQQHGYGNAVYEITKAWPGSEPGVMDQTFTIYEYLDAHYRCLVAVGLDRQGRNVGVLLERIYHDLGFTPATVTCRAGLDRLSGQFDQVIEMYLAQAKLMALEVLAVEKGIFPDTYLESRAGELARFIDGPFDGRSGKVNIVAGGQIRALVESPGYLTNPTIDRLERNSRVSASIPPEFGGESGSNLRTGRRGDAVLSATIDMPIAYAQALLATALESEAKIMAALALKNDPDATRTLAVGMGNADRPVTYVAANVFTDIEPKVSYPAAGADINSLVVGLGQRVGLGTMSKRTAARLDPFIDNAEAEHDMVIAEGLEQSLLAGIQQQASSGQIPPLVLAKIMGLVSTDRMELAEAMNKVTEDALKEQQAAQAEQQQMTPEAAMAGPAAQAMAGGAQPMSPVPGVGEGPGDLTNMLANLRLPLAGMAPKLGPQAEGGVRV